MLFDIDPDKIRRCKSILSTANKNTLHIYFPKDVCEYLRKIYVDNDGEYAGSFYTKDIKSESYGEVINVGVDIGSLVTNNLCTVDLPKVLEKTEYNIYFHTHPDNCARIHNSKIGWPSGIDFVVGLTSEYVISVVISHEGIYTFFRTSDFETNFIPQFPNIQHRNLIFEELLKILNPVNNFRSYEYNRDTIDSLLNIRAMCSYIRNLKLLDVLKPIRGNDTSIILSLPEEKYDYPIFDINYNTYVDISHYNGFYLNIYFEKIPEKLFKALLTPSPIFRDDSE